MTTTERHYSSLDEMTTPGTRVMEGFVHNIAFSCATIIDKIIGFSEERHFQDEFAPPSDEARERKQKAELRQAMLAYLKIAALELQALVREGSHLNSAHMEHLMVELGNLTREVAQASSPQGFPPPARVTAWATELAEYINGKTLVDGRQ